MVKAKNVGGIRDRYLHERWAEKRGFNLAQMKRERAHFLQFIEHHIYNVVERDVLTKNESPGFFLNRDDGEVLCASVRYLLIFANGTQLWLAKFETRPLLDAREQNEFDRCSGRSQAQDENEISRDFNEIILPSGTPVYLDRGSREILRALKSLGSLEIPSNKLKCEISRIRGARTLGDSYSPIKVMRGSAAGQAILSEGVVRYEQRGRTWLYSLQV
jgi:hypothetical protein